MEGKKNYSPPGWLIQHFDKTVILDEERAKKFEALRKKLCDTLGDDNEACNPTNLWTQALDLLLAFYWVKEQKDNEKI